jgi:ATP-dependent DNA helicase RecG
MRFAATDPITHLKGVGDKLAEKLTKLDLYKVQDLLFHLPSRYEDRTRIYPIGDLKPFTHVSIEGEVQSSNIVYGRKRMLTVKLADTSGTIQLRFFHFSAAQKDNLIKGARLKCFGEIRTGKQGLEMMHPEYRLLTKDTPVDVEASLTPVYPTTEGVRQITLRNLTEQIVETLSQAESPQLLPELLPEGLYQQQISLQQALLTLHRPAPDIAIDLLETAQHPAQQRLIIEELLAHQISVKQVRQQNRRLVGHAISVSENLTKTLLASLPFQPTQAQQRVVKDIHQDLTKTQPMMRLVQGDVGSGKTLVAALSALPVIEAGFQVALMAPTELLAEQHIANFQNWFESLGVKVGWLAGKLTAKQKQAILEQLEKGEIQLLIGTHAIFQPQVNYQCLALVIIDEQHRFGVHQRLALREKGASLGIPPHQLIMTATPIPRTLAMTAYADLDTSIIDELPPGRTPVKTVVIPDTRRAEIIQRVKQVSLEQGRQTYWVCTLIEESEALQCQTAEDTCASLAEALPELKVGLVHGRMKAAEKQVVMQSFKQGELNLLVATTVIEVGVDVPNASLMVIENPERLGMAQLHQLRGRVGRGSVESHCVLLYQSPLSKTANKRLTVLRKSNDGFYIAQQDLNIRGPGELLGSRQTGLVDMRIADLVRDQALIPQAQQLAEHIWQHHPDQAKALMHRWLPNKEALGHA